ncbi:MAG TPA: LysR family transcriptional regulator [Casimicrobiaceae bacterium]|nr:LysR family transcriptional regulator [Casimicrobiaceae bacterium]
MITLRQLQYFARIVELGNITRAAEQLYVAQPALGLQIRQLESELAVKLLNRHSRGVSPTRAGRLLYERACELLRLLEETTREVTAVGRNQREGVVLGLTNGFANIVGRELLLGAQRDLAGVELSIIEERSSVLIDALERHEIDLALAYEVHERPGLLRIPLLEEEMLFVTSPTADLRRTRPRVQRAPNGARPKARAARVRVPKSAGSYSAIEFRALAAFPLVMPGPRDGVRQQVLNTAKRLAIPLNLALEVSSISMMKRIVACGDAAAVMPYGNVIDELERGSIVARRIAKPVLKRTMYLVRPLRRSALNDESGMIDLIAAISRSYVDALGPLATPLDALTTGRLGTVVAGE